MIPEAYAWSGHVVTGITGIRGDPGTRRWMDIRGQSWQQFEGVDMRRPDYGEMATVQRCKLRYPEPFASRHH